ncbi:DUF928 domain-containing protein [Microcoleus sp. FACHB-1515]|uniref:DUF928 domain-containing protein n=1 Tax=Cyanophyceae TaxID=3028117 RepID=UPI00168423BA|nr:DUF928 domain-containing protein [Microcoleus sp. FACHB-1515]MBD2088574.1 DUF928 domain-containing protein [Microcoleus sp. FACHB-1515]
MKIHLARSIAPVLTAAVLLAGSPAIASVQFIPPPPPDQGYPPGSLRGGASRGDCPPTATPLTALAPAESVWGLTTRDRPTFWFYVPYSLTDDRPATFVLLDSDRNYVYQTSSIRSTQAGIIKITLPPDLPPLAVGRYQWTLMIQCEVDNPVFTQGSIDRIALPADLRDRLAQSSPAEQGALFADAGIWYDALTTLAELHSANPTDRTTTSNWHSFLQSVGLSDLADQPLID